jgi:ubiquinone biosynthesis UbiH/UbiF/VisC/COQ6 family hydroxylase
MMRPSTATRGSAARNFDVVVVGSGVTAAVTASLLVVRKVVAPDRLAVVGETTSAVAPPSAADAWDLRVFALSTASRRILNVAGVWPQLAADKCCAYERMCVWDSGGEPEGRGSVTFDCADLGEPNLGTIVEGRALQTASRLAARALGVVGIDSGIAGIATDESTVSIRLADGRELRSALVIVADGTESPTRRMLGIHAAGHGYHQDALVAHVRTARPHRHTAWQRFLPGGPLALLPLPDGRSSLVWTLPCSEAQRLRALDPVAFGAALTAASGEVLGVCEVTTPLASFPLKLQYALHYVKPRVALVGDAAHAVHPLAGQGLNLGLMDGAALAAVLEKPGTHDHWGELSVLRRYERWRRSENMPAATALDALERLFGSSDFLTGRLRMAGLGAVERLPFLKRDFAARALGLRGDVPDFLRGP